MAAAEITGFFQNPITTFFLRPMRVFREALPALIRPIWVLCLFPLLLIPGPASARIIEAESLMLKIIEGYQRIYQGYLEVEVRVFDPEAFFPLTEDAPEEQMLYQLPQRGFNQRIVWVRDEYLLIETLDSDQRPLHFYVFEPMDRRYSKNLGSDRFFLEEDVEFPQLYFFTKHQSFFKRYLNRLSIAPDRVQIVQHNKSFAYRLGDDKTNLMVDPDRFRILEINSELQISGRYYPMRIVFSDWDPEWNELPRKTTCFVKSRLFKEITVVFKQKHLSSNRHRFLEKYGAYLPPVYGFSLQTDYGR